MHRISSVSLAVGLLLTVGCGESTTTSRPATPAKTTPAAPAATPATDPGAGPAAVPATGPAAVPAEGGWGNLKGRFVYDGPAPAPKPLSITKDVEVCSAHKPVDETIVVASGGGLANVLVFLRPPRGAEVAVHEDYAASAKDNVELDNKNCRFAPHLAVLRTGQTLLIKNSDPVGHNTKGDCFVNPAFNVLIPAGGSVEQNLEQAEKLPFSVGCNIHPWMKGYVMVRDDPYMVVSGEDGTFEIKNVPTGEHEFQFWHEAPGYLGDVETALGPVSSKGRIKIGVAEGENDLGEIKVPPSALAG